MCFFTLESGKILVIKEENISERKKMYSILRAEELAFARTPSEREMYYENVEESMCSDCQCSNAVQRNGYQRIR